MAITWRMRRVPPEVLDRFLAVILAHLENLRRFYGLAADAGQAVVKRTYV